LERLLPPIGYRVVTAEQRGAKIKKKLEIDPLHAAELNRRAAETGLPLRRLYDSIEPGVARYDDPRSRSASQASTRSVTRRRPTPCAQPQCRQRQPNKLSRRRWSRGPPGRRASRSGSKAAATVALAQRVEVADREVGIIGSKSSLLQTLPAAAGVKPLTLGVPSSVLNWRRGRDSNPRYP
jgi:site-specific DNA recombinase